MREITVKDLMSTNLITLEQNETIDLAGEIMQLARVRHLPVVDGDRLVGLVTHRDLLKAQISSLAQLSRDETEQVERKIPATAIMQEHVKTVSPATSALDAARLLQDHKYGCLPVVEQGRLVGIITEADFLGLVIRAFETVEKEEEQGGRDD